MNDHLKSREEFLKELEELKLENESLKTMLEQEFTSRKQAEEALKESEKNIVEESLHMSELKYRFIVETSGAECFYIDETGRYKFMNHQFASIFGKTPDDLINKTIWDLYPKDQADYRYEAIKRVFQTGEIQTLEVEVPLPDKTLFFLATISPLRDQTGKVILALNHSKDITELKKAEQEIKLKNEQLLKLNSEKDKFFSILAHDLKNPFQGFLSLTQLIAEDAGNLSVQELARFGANMNQAARNLFALLKNLLDWAQIHNGKMNFQPEELSISDLIAENVKAVNEIGKQKGVMIINTVTVPVNAYFDEKMINSVLLNLITNAVKFTPRNGTVTINAKKNDNEMIEISVSDRGVGMPKSLVEKLFKFSEKTGRKGTDGELSTGLGLLLCKEFIDKNGGKIWVESQENMGSTFYFNLPQDNKNKNE